MIPRKLTEKIANRTVENIKAYGRQRGWRSTELVKAWARKDAFGVKLDKAQWLIFQNFGTKEHIPWNLEGKVVPMEFGFRKAVDVGMPGFVKIDGLDVWREAKWLNPGIQETDFIQDAAKKALQMYKHNIAQYEQKVTITMKRASR